MNSRRYHYITSEDRRKIAHDLNRKKPPRQIAQEIGITLQTLYREMKRGGAWRAEVGLWFDYDPKAAEKACDTAIKRKGHRRARA